MRRKQYEGEDNNCEDDLQDYYVVEKIIDMKIQRGKKYFLVKWLGWDVKTATWEEEQNISHLAAMVRDFQMTKKNDKMENIGLKLLEDVQSGLSPYEQTKHHGHFLYGDEIERIVGLRIIQQQNKKIVYVEIQWNIREDGNKPTNSLIDSQMVIEHDPKKLINFYESKVRLMVTSQEIVQ